MCDPLNVKTDPGFAGVKLGSFFIRLAAVCAEGACMDTCRLADGVQTIRQGFLRGAP